MTKVLVICDDAATRCAVRDGFALRRFSPLEADSAAAGLRAAAFAQPDLIILDADLADLEGAEVLERIRSWTNVPLIVLSAEAGEKEKVRLFELGAEDYLVKPFALSELLARSEAVLRRHLRSSNRDPVVRAGPLSIDLTSRLVRRDGKRLYLTRKEYSLLRGLAAYAGFVVTHQHLIKEIWGDDGVNIQYLRLLVRKLRQKVEIDPARPRLIVSESGVGYRLDRGGRGAVTSNQHPVDSETAA